MPTHRTAFIAPVLTPVLATLALPALADTDVSRLIADTGLAATAALLSDLPEPTASETFALGGVQFLSSIEAALQTRYRMGIHPEAAFMPLPVLRLPIPENPNPDPFEPQVIADLFATILDGMETATATLANVEGEVSLRIDTADIWFDIDANGQRDPGEDLGSVAGAGLGTPLPAITVNFDTADAHWLRAYAHLLAGLSEIVLAFDPTQAITEIRDASAAIDSLNASTGFGMTGMYDLQFGEYVDYAAMVITALERQPDPDRTRAAQAHFLSMITANRDFWQAVARETDNDAEWIPNKAQQSATGLHFPPDTGTIWLAVLSEAEAVLRGDALIPHWRLSDGAGLDLDALMQNPPEVDIIGIIQGVTVMPYATTGRVMDWTSFDLFAGMIGGNTPLYMVMLN